MGNPCKERRSIFQRKSDNKRRYQDNASHHISFVQQGLGYFLTTREMLAPELDPEVCFLPLEPQLPTRQALVWKKHAVFSKAAEIFKSIIIE